MRAELYSAVMSDPITGRDHIIDSATVTARILWLQDQSFFCDEEESEELEALLTLEAKMRVIGGWAFGVIHLIKDSYFVEYAQEYAGSVVGFVFEHAGSRWPLSCIDWEQATRELRQDYMSVEFDGETYWFLS